MLSKGLQVMSKWPVKDYSAKLAEAKARLGAKWKGHPDHDPLDHPHMYAPWRIKMIKEARNASH